MTSLKSANALFMWSWIWHSVVGIASINSKAAGIVRRFVNDAGGCGLCVRLADQHF